MTVSRFPTTVEKRKIDALDAMSMAFARFVIDPRYSVGNMTGQILEYEKAFEKAEEERIFGVDPGGSNHTIDIDRDYCLPGDCRCGEEPPKSNMGCTHPDHVDSKTCLDRAVGCSRVCGCCTGLSPAGELAKRG